MCLANPLAAGALSIGGQVAGYVGAAQTARAQAKYQNKVYTQVAANALQNYKQQINQTFLGLEQDRLATSDQAVLSAANAQANKASVNVAAAEAGVAGNTVESLLMDFDRINATNQSNLRTNLKWRQQQAGQQLLSYQANAKNAVASATPQPVVAPSPLGTLLQIGGTAVQTFDQYQYQNRKGPYGNI